MTVNPPHGSPAVDAKDRWLGNVLDVVLAGASATAITITSSVAAEPTNQSSTVAAYVLGITMGGLLLFRRQQPVLVLMLSLIAVMVYNITDYPSVSPIWPLLVPLYTVARYGQMLIGAAVGASTMLISAGWILNAGAPSLQLLDGIVREATVLAVVLVAGTALRNKELFAQEFTARLTAERRQQNREATRRILEERLRIARELHDVTAHTVAVVGVQINLARELIDDDPEAAREILENTRRINVDAIGELQAAVRLLREDGTAAEPERHPMPDETQIESLLDRAVESGLDATFAVEGEPRPVPPAVGLTLYRIAQESMTNVLRHARADHVRVLLRYRGDGIGLEVVNDGREDRTPDGPAAGGPAGSGYGVAGMHERATSMGGTVTAGPLPGGGFAVRAWLPSPAPVPLSPAPPAPVPPSPALYASPASSGRPVAAGATAATHHPAAAHDALSDDEETLTR